MKRTVLKLKTQRRISHRILASEICVSFSHRGISIRELRLITYTYAKVAEANAHFHLLRFKAAQMEARAVQLLFGGKDLLPTKFTMAGFTLYRFCSTAHRLVQ